MRKLSLLLAICLMLVCLVACNEEPEAGATTTSASTEAKITTQTTEVTDTPTVEETTKAPETPQSNWTGRY